MAEIAFDDLDYEPETIGDLDSFILGDFDIKPASFLPRLKSDHPTLESGSKKRGGLKGRSKHTNVKSNKESRNLHKHHHGGKGKGCHGNKGKGHGGKFGDSKHGKWNNHNHKHFNHHRFFKNLRAEMTPQNMAKVGIMLNFCIMFFVYGAFLCSFGFFLRAHRQLEAVKKLDQNASDSNMSQDQRNRVACSVQNCSQRAQRKIVKQVERKYEGNTYQYVPPCEAPIVEDAFIQKQVYPKIEQESLAKPLVVPDRRNFDEEERQITDAYIEQLNQIRAQKYDKEC